MITIFPLTFSDWFFLIASSFNQFLSNLDHPIPLLSHILQDKQKSKQQQLFLHEQAIQLVSIKPVSKGEA
jgi:hypothetical protein